MNRTTRFLLSSNHENLQHALATFRNTVTVEAEYGDVVVAGTMLTLAHHGSRSANPPPCMAEIPDDMPYPDAIGLSHVDLDALGGILRVIRDCPDEPDFWKVAGFVDVNGPHRLSRYVGATPTEVARLYAWWAWSNEHRQYAPRDGSVIDVADWVDAAYEALVKIFRHDPAMMQAGENFRLAERALNERSFRDYRDSVVARESDDFVNHLYETPSGQVAVACVSYNEKTRAVTVSLADPDKLSAKEIVQSLWGPEAGGHAGCAGGPRAGLDRSEYWRAVRHVRALIGASA